MDELKAYNPMIPEPGQVCATLFLELTSDEQVREWLPKLAGLENSISLLLSDGTRIKGEIDQQHAAGLTRDDVTAAVHYLTFNFTPEQVNAFEAGDVIVECSQPNYLEACRTQPHHKSRTPHRPSPVRSSGPRLRIRHL